MKTLARTLMALLLCFGQQVFAADAPRPEVRLVAHKVVSTATAEGVRESLQPLQELRPGDTIEYEATYVNRTSQTMRDVQVTVPVPAGGLEYVSVAKVPGAGSLGSPSSASTDGNVFAPLPLVRTETTAEGKRVVRAVPLAEYRQLRWSLGDVPAGASRTVHARMRLPALSTATVDTARGAN